MIDLEREKQNFKDHVATFTDYGNIKILDFKNPNNNPELFTTLPRMWLKAT